MNDFTIPLPQRSTWILRRVILYTAYPHYYHVIPNHLLTLSPPVLYCYVLQSLISATLYSPLSFGIPLLHPPQPSFLSAFTISVRPQEFPFFCQQLLCHYLLFLWTLSTFSFEHFLPYWNQRNLLPWQPFWLGDKLTFSSLAVTSCLISVFIPSISCLSPLNSSSWKSV